MLGTLYACALFFFILQSTITRGNGITVGARFVRCVVVWINTSSVHPKQRVVMSSRMASVPVEEDGDGRVKSLIVARRFHPSSVLLTTYIDNLNGSLPRPIVLQTSADASNSSYLHLLQTLYVAFPSSPLYPENPLEGLNVPGAIPIDTILADVIASTLRKHTTLYEAYKANALTVGFMLSADHGSESILRNLDARSPSAAIQRLRSGPYRSLARRIGHVVFRHLLLEATLLQSIHSASATAFLQLCGPPPPRPSPRRLSPSRKNLLIRKDLMYRTPSRRGVGTLRNPGLPPSHHLQHLSSSRLFSLIFSTHDYDRPPPFPARGKYYLRHRPRLPRRLLRLLPLLDQIIARLEMRSFRRILGLACPLQPSRNPAAFVALSSPPKRVAAFLFACARQILPRQVLGSLYNWDRFEKGVHHFVRRRYQNESFDVGRFFTHRFSVSAVEWLQCPASAPTGRVVHPTDLRFRKTHLKHFMVWIFRGLLLPLVQHNFYVTEVSTHGNRVFYFRREVWTRLVDPANNTMLRGEGQFSVLSKEHLAACTMQRETFLTRVGPRLFPYPVLLYHHMRFIPKKGSLRGIQRPRVKMLLGFQKGASKYRSAKTNKMKSVQLITRARASVKSLMNSIRQIVHSERKNQHSSSTIVFSLDDIYSRFLTLKSDWRQKGCPKMYACCVDITRSFDTIPLDFLFSEVIPTLFTRDRYVLLKYRLSKPDVTNGGIINRFAMHVCTEPGEEASFIRLLLENLASRHSGAIFSDLASVTAISRTDILSILQEFLTNNLISVPRRQRRRSETGFAVQCRGLPQGHQLSPLLTSLFYAHIEQHDLKEFLPQPMSRKQDTPPQEICKPDDSHLKDAVICLLMRFIDDTIFLSSDQKQALHFLKRMSKGWAASHGFSINMDKTRSSFARGEGAEGLINMPWCGLIIDTKTLELRADYSRYNPQGGRLRDVLMIEHDCHPGRVFMQRAWSCFHPKLHALLLDGQINSRRTIAINIYQAALLACLKLCAYATEIQLERGNTFHKVVTTTIPKFVSLVNRSVSSQKVRLLGCQFPFSVLEVRYLCAHSFYAAVTKKLQPRKALRPAIKMCTLSLQQIMASAVGELQKRGNDSIVASARTISNNNCRDLWSIQL